jgi:hypothetical protein
MPPLNDILIKLNLTNDDLVRASTEQLTFKQVQKARAGKHVTANIEGKIVRALALCGHTYRQRELFPRQSTT